MSATRVQATVADGVADGELITPPSGAGPFPLAVMIPDAGGIRDATTSMAEQLAEKGYAVLLVNPFWRQQPYAPFDVKTVFGDPTERARLMAIIGKVQAPEVVADAVALIDAITDARVAREKIAAFGYCMGGRIAFVLAAMLGDRVVAAAPIHAGGLVSDKPDSPHLSASKIRAALYLGVADQDPSCTPEHQAALKQSLDAAGVRYELELHTGARHGFAVPDFPVYDAAAAAKHWQRIEALFAQHLPRP